MYDCITIRKYVSLMTNDVVQYPGRAIIMVAFDHGLKLKVG